jgi:Protein of unknown function (DUF2750)
VAVSVHLVAELEENYRRFVDRALAGGGVWGLACDEGRLCCTSHDGEQAVIPFWSDAAYARRALADFPDEGYAVVSVPLVAFLGDVLGRFQHDDVLVGPNYTRDLAGLELDPREVFEAFRARMSEAQSAQYRACLESASIVSVGHPAEKLARRVERFARVVASEGGVASVLVGEDGPRHVDVGGKPGESFVPIWSSGQAAERARLFALGPGDGARVASVEVGDFLASAADKGWSIGVEPTVGLACAERPAGALLALVRQAAARDEEDDDEDEP